MEEAEKKENELHERFKQDACSAKPLVGYEWFKETDELRRTIEREGTLLSDLEHKPKGLDTILNLFTKTKRDSQGRELLEKLNSR